MLGQKTTNEMWRLDLLKDRYHSWHQATLELTVTRLEAKGAIMLVRINIPLSLADELTPLFQDIFPDTEIADTYPSRRMKTTCFVNSAVASHFKENLVATMKENHFSTCIACSSDNGAQKMNH